MQGLSRAHSIAECSQLNVHCLQRWSPPPLWAALAVLTHPQSDIFFFLYCTRIPCYSLQPLPLVVLGRVWLCLLCITLSHSQVPSRCRAPASSSRAEITAWLINPWYKTPVSAQGQGVSPSSAESSRLKGCLSHPASLHK